MVDPLRSLFVALLTFAMLLSGCLGAKQLDEDTDAARTIPPRPSGGHVLDQALEPPELTAPVFKLLGVVAKGGPVYGAGEPNVWAHADGTLYVAFAGCDNGPYYFVQVPGSAPCGHGPVYKSTDRGQTWKRLNDASSGRLARPGEGPNANGDNDVTVDANGTVYVSNLGQGIHAQRSMDGGATWKYVGNVVPRTNPGASGPAQYNSDRNWMAAAGPGHMVVAWMGSAPIPAGQSVSPRPRAVGINVTFDGGETWGPTTYVSKSIGWLGSVQFHPDGQAVYIPFTKPSETSASMTPEARIFELRVARSQDGGRTWEDVDTTVRVRATSNGGHWSGVHMAPALDVTADGTVVYAWSEEIPLPGDVNAMGSRVRAITSKDNGTTWGEPLTLSDASRGQAILPWVAGGGGDRYAVTFYSAQTSGDSDYVPAAWRLDAVVVDGRKTVGAVIDPEVHLGNICTRGGGCQHPVSDRELLDFFESDLLPDGSLVVVYPADDVRNGKSIEQRFAIQAGGTPLFVRQA